jgi:hypothetical protein
MRSRRAALLATQSGISRRAARRHVRGVRRLGLGKPGRYFGGKLLLRLAHAHRTSPCAHWHWPEPQCRRAPHVRASRDRAKIEAHVAATERALADTPKMSDLEVARRIAVSHVPLWAINLCVVPTLTFENVCLRQNCAPMCDFAAPPPAPSVLPASSVPSRVVWTKAHTW